MGDYCFSGGVDGTVRCWNLPPPTVDPYDTFDASVMFAVFEGGTKKFFITVEKGNFIVSYSTPVLCMNKGYFCSVWIRIGFNAYRYLTQCASGSGSREPNQCGSGSWSAFKVTKSLILHEK
jgi:hypothetical protein